MAAMATLLAANGLSHLLETLQGHALAELEAMERVALLSKLKAIGVDRLGDRQKLATAIAKAARSSNLAADGDAAAAKRGDLVPQGFQIFCHNTTLEDGSSLDNNDPAPEFVIAALEKSTGVQRPANAHACSLHQLNLHFMSGGTPQ